jgi:hypothetical protein
MTQTTDPQARAAFMGGALHLAELAATDPLMSCFGALRRQEV